MKTKNAGVPGPSPPTFPSRTPPPASHRNDKGKNGASRDRGLESARKGSRALENGRELDQIQLLTALTSLRNGDFTVRLPIDLDGMDGRIADAFNDVVSLNQRLAQELDRVSLVVGKEGRISQRAAGYLLRGSWAAQIGCVNALIDDLVHPTRETARVIGAVAKGDLSQTMAIEIEGRPLAGEFARTARVVNTMVNQLSSFASEVTRVAREVGTEGRLGGQAKVKGVAGTWKDLTDSVNSMARNLTSQVRNIAAVTTAVAKGDLSKKITVDVRGEILELKDTINTMVDQLSSFASEVTRVAREVGSEGRLGGQAEVRGVAGTWKDLTDSVNSMARNLTAQVRNIAAVTTAVATGDLSKKITVDVKGEILELKNTINTMVDQLNSFASEVTRVAREVGSEGRLGGQAEVSGVGGTWKDLTVSVNSMAGNLTSQVRNIADVTKAVASGDLSKKITVDVRGEILELKDTVNTMVDQLNSFASEVTRVAREVGTEGSLGGQAEVKGVAGTWKDLTDSVNSMAGNLTSQVRNIADVTKAVAAGDLSKKITVDVKGEILELKNTVNTMVDQLSSFASEVTRVAREVGTEGKLGGQADVKGVGGTWKDLTDNVNFMAGNLTSQVRNIAAVTTAVATGDLSKKITVDVKGEILELKNTINTMVDQLNSFASEVTRVAREVGTEGKLGGQAEVKGVGGTWKDLTDNVNFMAGNLTNQVRNIAAVTTAVAKGDLSKKITVDARGEILELKDTINTMVDQLNSFASEVTRVAREVGTEGKLGGQADVKGAAGTWKGLTDNVNFMAGNLTNQVRGIAKVVTAVANGDLKRKLVVEAKGEIAELADTINNMIDTLATFADQVTGVAREVGVEGKLGGQASVPGAAGTWKDLTDNVNQLAANLSTQVRAIADVATAVTRGDLTRAIDVAAQGEVAALKDNINEMIRNLRETTLKNAETDWLKTNLAKFSRMLQGQKDLLTVARLILSELAPVVSAQHGVFYILDTDDEEIRLRLLASYAYKERKNIDTSFKLGEALVGQCALQKQKIVLRQVPGDYIRITSGLGDAPPLNVIVMPVVFETEVKAVIELASFDRFSETHQAFLEQLTESIGIVINTIEANTLTEDLLSQSQSLAHELQSRQAELTTTNAELEEKAELLAQQNAEVERKNREVEQARQALEEKAKQLALTSKYKSEFLANMSHELRTPLNSLLILSDYLCRNLEGNLDDRQVEYSRTIHSSGNDLLALINDILDLSKVESGTVVVDVGEVRLRDLVEHVERAFQPVADSKGLEFKIEVAPGTSRSIHTDIKRLQQILKNLLSNAFKFTERGGVSLRLEKAASGWAPENQRLSDARSVLSFAVVDTGVGIPPEKQQIVFEAFQQADGSTNRKYGGTGLGLAISREIAQLLGGELKLSSEFGQGSSFTLYLPQVFVPPRVARASAPAPAASPDELAATGREDGAPHADPISDDREDVRPGDSVLLVIGSNLAATGMLLDRAHDRGLKAVTVPRGAAGLGWAKERPPAFIALDADLPDVDGWQILKRLKDDLDLRHIPVYVITTGEERHRALRMGAAEALSRRLESPDAVRDLFASLDRRRPPGMKSVLVMDDDAERIATISDTLSGLDAEVRAFETEAEGLVLLAELSPDLIVVGAGLAHQGAADFLEDEGLRSTMAQLPILVYGPGAGANDDGALEKLGSLPGVVAVQSRERLLHDAALHLHCRVDSLGDAQQTTLREIRERRPGLAGKKVLIVDDDIRNIFAMTSLLERYQMKVQAEETARGALLLLQTQPDVEVILMDIMMPDLDGYDAIGMIRETERFRALPIIALTARAMKGDREKCIEAGASDYIAKPVDGDYLIAMIHHWLFR